MIETEIRSLAPIEKRSSPDSIIIDSSNLAGYLVAIGFVARESQFAPRLDLSFCTPIIKDLYTEKQIGFVLSEDKRAPLLKTAEWMRTSAGDSAGPVTNKMIEYLEASAGEKASVEASTVVYFDKKEEVITASPINFGEFDETTVSTQDILKEGNIPMIEIHTHPDDSLFSRVDYSRMLVDLWNGSPVVKSIMVLCPNIQVLALATRETPLLDVDEANKLLEALDKSFDGDLSLKKLEKIRVSEPFKLHALINTNILEVARALNVKFYSSTDMQHFKEFSA